MDIHQDCRYQTVKDLIPWFVNGTLDESEMDLVNQHLRECAVCRAEVAQEIRMAQGFRLNPAQLTRLDRQQKTAFADLATSLSVVEKPTFGSWLKTRWGIWDLWHMHRRSKKTWQWALVASVLFGIGSSSFLLGRYTQEAPFVALTSPTHYQQHHVVQIVFQPDISLTEIHQFARQNQGVLLNPSLSPVSPLTDVPLRDLPLSSMPGEKTVYRLELPEQVDLANAIKRLREHPSILWVGVELK